MTSAPRAPARRPGPADEHAGQGNRDGTAATWRLAMVAQVLEVLSRRGADEARLDEVRARMLRKAA